MYGQDRLAEKKIAGKLIDFWKDASWYLPNDLPDELGRQSCLKEIICNPV